LVAGPFLPIFSSFLETFPEILIFQVYRTLRYSTRARPAPLFLFWKVFLSRVFPPPVCFPPIFLGPFCRSKAYVCPTLPTSFGPALFSPGQVPPNPGPMPGSFRSFFCVRLFGGPEVRWLFFFFSDLPLFLFSPFFRFSLLVDREVVFAPRDFFQLVFFLTDLFFVPPFGEGQRFPALGNGGSDRYCVSPSNFPPFRFVLFC